MSTTKGGSQFNVMFVLLLCGTSPGLHDNVGSCFRNISLSNTLPDTLQAINLSCSPNGCGALV